MGAGAKNYLPNWIDILVVIVFSLAIFYLAVGMSQSTAEIERAVEADRAHDPLDDLVTS